MTSSLLLRDATPDDAALLCTLVRELAQYEHEPDAVRATPDDLARQMRQTVPPFRAVIAEHDGNVAGFALYSFNYSTWRARPGLYLEDLFVRPAHRRGGVGRALLAHLARTAVEAGCGRMEWAVLDWNEPAIAFYRSLGATPMDQWTVFRLDDAALQRLGG